MWLRCAVLAAAAAVFSRHGRALAAGFGAAARVAAHAGVAGG